MLLKFGALVILGLLGLSACTTEYRNQRDPEIRFADATERYEAISLHKVFHDGTMVGWVDTMRVIDGDSNDYNDRYEMFVLDNDKNVLGFVTDRGQAYRYRAHSQPEMVGEHSELNRSVRGVFGFSTGIITLEKQFRED